MKEIMSISADDMKEGFERAFSFNDEVKYTNSIEYKAFVNKVLEAMGDLIFCIEIPENRKDFYILSDFGVATIRERINNYFNPDAKDVSYIDRSAIKQQNLPSLLFEQIKSFPTSPWDSSHRQ
jgi:hypothetical protein